MASEFPVPPSDDSTLELVDRMKAGDEDAFGELYRRYHDELLFAVRAHLGPGLRAALQSEDVLQSVAVDAFRALRDFEPRGPGSLRAYLHAMVVNKIRARADWFGAVKRAGTVPLTPSRAAGIPEADAAPSYYEAERFERLEKALAVLPDEMRQVIVLRKIDGLSSREVAARMDRSDDAVRKLYSRAMARLATTLGEPR